MKIMKQDAKIQKLVIEVMKHVRQLPDVTD